MRGKVARVVLMLGIVAAVVALVEWLVGPAAAGSALAMIGIGLGAYYGAGWGGKEATKTEEYRQEWLNKRKKRTVQREDQPGDQGEGPLRGPSL